MQVITKKQKQINEFLGEKKTYTPKEAIVKIKQHRDIRGYILSNYKIKSIKHLGNVFSEVLSPVVTLNIQKEKVEENEIERKQDQRRDLAPNQGLQPNFLERQLEGNSKSPPRENKC